MRLMVDPEIAPKPMRSHIGFVAVLMFLLSQAVATASAQRQLSPEVEAFIEDMVQKHQFDRDSLRRVFGRVQARPAIIRAISTPGTARPWYEFRSRYVEPVRINAGIRFWNTHVVTLARASREYGVPEEIIVATLGVETLYGRNTGGYNVLEALSMLAFHYPPRAELFRTELEEYLLLARESGLDVANVKGSYAGAMGIPQFLPSSYRRFALDFDGDGRRDLWRTPADAIGSVANYYRAYGWRTGEGIVVPAEVGESNVDTMLAAGIKPHLKLVELRRLGVVPLAPVEDGVEAALFAMETETGLRYWLGLNNFYVITRYNRSVNYALAVHELARELRALMKPES